MPSLGLGIRAVGSIKEAGQCFLWTQSADLLMFYWLNLDLRTWLAFLCESENSFLSVDVEGKYLFRGTDKSAYLRPCWWI